MRDNIIGTSGKTTESPWALAYKSSASVRRDHTTIHMPGMKGRAGNIPRVRPAAVGI